MQHLDSSYREEDVADEAKIEDLLHRITNSALERIAAGWTIMSELPRPTEAV